MSIGFSGVYRLTKAIAISRSTTKVRIFSTPSPIRVWSLTRLSERISTKTTPSMMGIALVRIVVEVATRNIVVVVVMRTEVTVAEVGVAALTSVLSVKTLVVRSSTQTN